jgi:hypothetical protein
MTAKEYLNQLRTIDLRLRTMESELKKLRSDICNLRATDYSKDKISSGQPMDISDKVIRVIDEKDKITAEWNALLLLRNEARGYINKIKDYRVRHVLIERYIDCRAWDYILDSMNIRNSDGEYIEKYTLRQMYRYHSLGLKEIQEILDKKQGNVSKCH